MRNVLADILKTLTTIGFADIKVTGADDATKFESMTDNQQVIAKVKANDPIPDLNGEFGMTNLGVIKGLLNYAPFADDKAIITTKRELKNGVSTPVEITLVDASGRDASFRLSPVHLIANQPRLVPMSWDIVFKPTKEKVTELQQLTSIFSTVDPVYEVKTVDSELRFYIGGEAGANHRTYVVMEKDVGNTLDHTLSWNVAHLMSVLKLLGNDAEISIQARGMLRVVFSSEYAQYEFLLPAKKNN